MSQSEHIHRLRGGIGGDAHRIGDFFRLGVAQTGERIDQFGDDFFWRVMRDLFNVHAAFARSDEREFLRSTVGDHRHVILFLNICAFFDVQAPHFLTARAGLVRDQLHAQNLGGQSLHIVDAFGHFDPTAFAAPASVDLSLDHPNRAAEFLSGFNRFLHGEGGDAAWHTCPQ